MEKTTRPASPPETAEVEVAEKDHTLNDPVPVVLSQFASLSSTACIRKFWRLYCTGLLASLGAMYFGYSNSAMGNIIANEGFIAQFATVTDPDTGKPALNATHVSVWGVGSFVAQILIQGLAPITADRWGRKFNMWLLTFFLALCIVLQIVAKDWIVLLIAKLMGGFAGGLLSTSIMVYMSEIAMPQFRGSLLSSFSLLFALGQAILAIGLKALDATDPLKFRNLFYSEFVFCGIWMIPVLYLPESPVWLSSKGRHEQAKKSLRRLVGNVEGYDIEHEYQVIRYDVESSHQTSMKKDSRTEWRSLLTKVNLRRTIIATLPFTFQNFVGVPLIFNYTTYFFSLAGVADPFMGSIIIQLILLLGIITGFYLIDVVGRRQLVLYGGASMGVLTAIVGGLGFIEVTSSSGTALVALCSIWAFIYAVSLAPIGWVSLVEVSTPLLRAKTTSIASIIQTLTGILFNYTVPMMLSNQQAGWGQKTGLFFSGITYLFLIPCILLYPETKGRTYQELDELFASGIPAWKFAKARTVHQSSLEARDGVAA